MPRLQRVTAILFLSVAFSAIAPPSDRSAAGQSSWTLEVTPRTPTQGQAIRVRIRTSSRSEPFRVVAGGRSIRPYPVQGGFQTFIGTSPVTPPGTFVIRVDLMGAGGKRLERRTAQVSVRAGNFGTRRLTVPPRLLDPNLVAIERRKVGAALANPIPMPQWRGPFMRPVDGVVTSGYGVRSIYNGVTRGYHYGVDFRAPTGTPVHAAHDGVVTMADFVPLSGNIVFIDHGGGIYTSYHHLSATTVVRGTRVAQGDVVGRSGSTGLSTGPHLHWGMRINGVRVDPLPWIVPGVLTAP